jgi:C1A family cysteine protease
VRDSRTFAKKQARYHTNDTIIADHNRKNAHNHDPNTLVLGHNWTSDMEPEDYLGMLGLKSNSHNSIRDDRGDRYSSYRGIDVATTVDHWNDGYVLPIKDQGNCGSCWSFAAVTSFEGTIAKKYNRSPVRLSEQSLVDCTLTTNSANRDRFGKDYGMWGCQGGLLPPAWEFIKDNGIMTNEDYPYFSGTTGSEGECKHVDSKVVPERPTGWGMFTPSNTITEVKAKVAKQPMSVSLDASREAFQFYSSGVIPASADCGEQLNHAIVVVGYTDDEGAPDPSPNPDPSPGPSPDPSPNPDPEPPTPTPSGNCKVTKWWHTCDEAPARRRNL